MDKPIQKTDEAISTMDSAITKIVGTVAEAAEEINENKGALIDPDQKDGPGIFVEKPSTQFKRNRLLTLILTILAAFSFGNMALQNEILKKYNYSEFTPTKSAFIQALEKVTTYSFEFIFHKVLGKIFSLFKVPTIFGLRARLIDGSDTNMPTDQSNQETLKNNGKGRPYNQAHFHFMVDPLSGILNDVVLGIQEFIDERSAMIAMVQRTCEKAANFIYLFIADRGYESWNVFAHIHELKQYFIIRCKDIKSNGILSGLHLPDKPFDMNICVTITKLQTNLVKECKSAIPGFIAVLSADTKFDFITKDNPLYLLPIRIIHFLLPTGEYEMLATNLPIEKFPTALVVALYTIRWHVETCIKRIKTFLSLTNFHHRLAKLQEGEAWRKLTVYNIVSAITWMVNVFKSTGAPPEEETDCDVNLSNVLSEITIYANDGIDSIHDMDEALQYIDSVHPDPADQNDPEIVLLKKNISYFCSSEIKSKNEEQKIELMKAYLKWFEHNKNANTSSNSKAVNQTPYVIDDAPDIIKPKLCLSLSPEGEPPKVCRVNFGIAASMVMTILAEEFQRRLPKEYAMGSYVRTLLRFTQTYELGRQFKRSLRPQRSMSGQCYSAVS